MLGYSELFQKLGGIPLPFGESYPKILGKKTFMERLLKLPLGRDAGEWAAKVMANYDPSSSFEWHRITGFFKNY
jgi:hypothetical protein